MEKILKIIELEDYKENEDSWVNMAGYKVVTTDQEILLLIDNESNCCESWGWFWSNDDPQEFIGSELKDIEVTDVGLNPVKIKNHIGEYGLYDGGVMFVNLKTNIGILQFTAYNIHNGYYGHKAKIISKQLHHSESL